MPQKKKQNKTKLNETLRSDPIGYLQAGQADGGNGQPGVQGEQLRVSRLVPQLEDRINPQNSGYERHQMECKMNSLLRLPPRRNSLVHHYCCFHEVKKK